MGVAQRGGYYRSWDSRLLRPSAYFLLFDKCIFFDMILLCDFSEPKYIQMLFLGLTARRRRDFFVVCVEIY